MNRLDRVLRAYERFVSLPWKKDLSGAERVWFLVYDKMDERRIRTRFTEFEIATKKTHRNWVLCDLTDAFARWLAHERYRDTYFEDPDSLDPRHAGFFDFVVAEVRSILTKETVDGSTVVAVVGAGSLFGLISVSDLANKVSDAIKGRLLVFFPGEYDSNTYRLLGAKDGWNYLGIAITAETGVAEG